MNRNYLFRSRLSTRRYVLFAVLLQIAGTMLFVGLALALSRTNLPHDQVALVTFFATLVLVIIASYCAHRSDLRLLHSKIWPMDGPEAEMPAGGRVSGPKRRA